MLSAFLDLCLTKANEEESYTAGISHASQSQLFIYVY
jgi:hypothetical protein